MKYFKKIVILLFMIFMFGSFEISYANDNGSNKLLTDDVVNKLVWEDLEISDENLNYILNLDNEEQQKIESERLIYSNYKYRHSLRFFYDGYKELNTAEQYLVKIKPLEALVVRNAAIYSSNKTKKMYGESNADDDSDAFRHSYWNALMVKRLTHMKDIGLITRGVEVAKLFADAHEEEFIQTSLAKEMDLYNNQVGRNIAENYYLYNNYSFPSDDDLATIVKQHVDRGDMRKIFDNRLIPTTKKLPKVENIIKNEWRKNKDDKWIYYDENGNLTTGWKKIYDTWYYFDKNNIMQEGWQYINNNWYYLLPGSGAMQKGWVLVNNVYYYLVDSGEMQEGWLYYNNKYYYLTPGNGDMKKGWQYIGNDYYYFDDSGAMQTGWIYLDAYYYLNTGGQMQTGWKNIDGKTYYFGSDGRMVTGYVYINNVQYYFDSSGALSKSPGSGYNPNKPIIMLGVKKDGVELNV